MSNPNPSRTTHGHRRNSFPPPDPSKSSILRTQQPTSSYSSSSSSSSYNPNPTTHLSRARSPPPSLGVGTFDSDLQATKKALSKSAIFGKIKPFSQFCPQPDNATVKRAGLEKPHPSTSSVGDLVVKPMVVTRLGRSRSLCDPKLELSNFLLINGVKLVNADMPPFMQIHAVGCARKTCDSLEKFSSRALALSLKKEFDGEYGPAWHCIVGTSFGSFVTHSVGGFLYFSMDQKMHVLLFKTTVERAK